MPKSQGYDPWKNIVRGVAKSAAPPKLIPKKPRKCSPCCGKGKKGGK